MTNLLPFDDGFGWPVGKPFPMRARPGAHSVYARRSDLVVEWYDFGEDAPYETANLLIFDRPAQQALAGALGVAPLPCPHDLALEVSNRFASYFEVMAFAENQGVPFTKEVDFTP